MLIKTRILGFILFKNCGHANARAFESLCNTETNIIGQCSSTRQIAVTSTTRGNTQETVECNVDNSLFYFNNKIIINLKN